MLLRDHWADVLRVVAAALVATVSTIFTVWALSFATSDAVGMDGLVDAVGRRRSPTASLSVAIPLWARLSDRIGRKPGLPGRRARLAAS